MVVVVRVTAHPVVIVAGAGQRLDVEAPDRFEAHARAGGVQVRLERRDLGVVLQHGIGVELLIGFHRLDVDVHAVAEAARRAPELRLVAFRVELEPDFEVRPGVAAVRVEMHRVGDEPRPGRQETSGSRIEEVRVAPDLVNWPGRVAFVCAGRIRILVGGLNARAPDHVVEHVVPADRGSAAAARVVEVVDFLDLEGGDVTILVEPDVDAFDLAPPVGRIRLYDYVLRPDDHVGRPDVPGAQTVEHAQGRHVGRVPTRCAAVGPLRDLCELDLTERRIVLVLLNADVLLDVPGGHHAGVRPDAGPLLDGAGPRPHVFVSDERHRRHAVGTMAVLAAALQNRRDVLGERHLDRHRRLLGAQRRHPEDDG